MIPVTAVLGSLFGFVFASPFLLLLLFFLARGYIGEVMSGQRARASFKQNLEAATLNPADASAHYNLGLIHLQRKELDDARRRFERAIEIDANEVDAHYQLGRIARMQNRLPNAVQHFEQVVARDQQHAQHEIWREIGATYLAAGQFADAYDALERFLAHRTSDPEGLYLSGRALAGMGRRREAAQAMQSCIEAVKTAPASSTAPKNAGQRGSAVRRREEVPVVSRHELAPCAVSVPAISYLVDTMTAKTFEEVEVWRKAHAWVLDVYRLTEAFPKHELFGLTS